MAKNITPILRSKSGKVATSLTISINSHELDSDLMQVTYSLRDEKVVEIETEIISIGNDVLKNWGATNDQIWNAVAEVLSVKIENLN